MTSTFVVWNPQSGKRRGARRIARLRDELGAAAEFLPTERPGHAVELARRAAEQGADRIIAAGGDGTTHEVANGILQSGAEHVALIVAPTGSANDYAYSLRSELQQSQPPGDSLMPVDVGRVRDGDSRERFFIAGLGLGLNGLVTVESQRIRWLQGLPLYGLATLRALARLPQRSEMSVQINGGVPLVGPTLLLSVLIGKREGNFLMGPRARLGDGWFDYVHASVASKWEVLRLLPRVALFGPPERHPAVTTGLCQSVRVQAADPLTVHTDGEIFCVADDGVRELQIELLPARLNVGLWSGGSA